MVAVSVMGSFNGAGKPERAMKPWKERQEQHGKASCSQCQDTGIILSGDLYAPVNDGRSCDCIMGKMNDMRLGMTKAQHP
jgi:hypothetical protein